jgi:glycosyltransferase involved in cell wall biosynthesis
VRNVGIGFSSAKLLTDLNLAVFALSLSRKYEFDVIHGVEEGAFIGALIGRRTGAPVIYDMDSIMSHDASSGIVGRIPYAIRFMRAAERWAIGHSSVVMTIAPPMADYVRSIDPSKEVAIVPDVPLPMPPTGPEIGRIRAEMPFLAGKGTKIVLYTGSLAGYQGMDLLIAAMARVVGREPKALLVVVGGDDGEIEKLKSLPEMSGMVDNVRFLGKKPPEEIPHLLGIADVLVSPRRGGVNPPAKVYTYMQSGRPLVATDVPAHSSVLGRDSATFVDTSPDGIADGILWALAHPAEALEMASRAKASVSHLTPESQARQVLEIYQSLADRFKIERRIAA